MSRTKISEPLPLYIKVALSLLGLLIFSSSFSRQLTGQAWDFQSYFNAAARLIEGQSLYIYGSGLTFTAAPIISVPFTFFHLFEFETARWIYAALHALISIACPYILYLVLKKDPKFNIRAHKESFCTGVLLSFLATFRFIDSEFHVSQIGLWITCAFLLGTYALTLQNRFWKFMGLIGLILSSLLKINNLLSLSMFLKSRSLKTYLSVLAALVLVFLIPNPIWSLEWIQYVRDQFKNPNVNMSAISLQGFFPLAAHKLGIRPTTLWPLALALPFAAYAFSKTPGFTVSRIVSEPKLFLTTASLWTLLSIMIAPLPWQYTYSFLWIVFPLMWISASYLQKRFLWFIALFLGLTPQAIVGKPLSVWLEQNQSIFLSTLALWILLLQICIKNNKKT